MNVTHTILCASESLCDGTHIGGTAQRPCQFFADSPSHAYAQPRNYDYTRDRPELFANGYKYARVARSSFESISQNEVTHSAMAAHIYVVEREVVTNERSDRRYPDPSHYYCRRHCIVTSYSDVTSHYTALCVLSIESSVSRSYGSS